MIALQDVQHIYVRATYRNLYRGDEIFLSELSLDYAADDTASASNTTALGVEHCTCPPQYTGLSCQNAADGYTIQKVANVLNEPQDIALVGRAVVCACNSHSEKCDPKTGRCFECRHETEGASCERCKAGFYGDATSGSADACKRCECPSADRSFSATCAPANNERGFRCTACPVAHRGAFCEFCADGFYGKFDSGLDLFE